MGYLEKSIGENHFQLYCNYDNTGIRSGRNSSPHAGNSRPKDIDPWLKVHHTATPDAMGLLKPYNDPLTYYEVSKMVNSPKNNRPECIIPVNDLGSLSLF